MALKQIAFLAWIAGASVTAQTPPRFVGTVAAVHPETLEISVKLDQGETRAVKIIPESVFQRIAPGEKDLKNAQTISATNVAGGDRVLVAVEPGTSDLRRLVVMASTDIAKRNDDDKLDWQKRGVSGVVSAKTANEITIKTRSMMGETETRLQLTPATLFRRYAPDSVKFADAKTSGAAELSPGDQVRARGNKGADGVVAAEELVFGTFVTKAGKIASVDLAAHSVTITELGTSKELTIRVTADSQLKRMPSFGGGMPGGGAPGGGMSSGGPPAGMPGGGMPGGGRPPDLTQMLERMPVTPFEDLKPGETIVVSSTKAATANGPLTAITLLAGADMLIQMAAMQQRSGGGGPPGGMPGGGMPGGMGMGGLDGLQLPSIMQ